MSDGARKRNRRGPQPEHPRVSARRPSRTSVLGKLVAQAVRMGAPGLEVDYRDGHDEVFAIHAGAGVLVGRLASDGPEARRMRSELAAFAGKRSRMLLDGEPHRIRCEAYASFGETARRLDVQR